MDGVQQCDLNFTTETLRITGTAEKSAVTGRVCQANMGYTLIDPQEQTADPQSPPQNFFQIHVGAA